MDTADPLPERDMDSRLLRTFLTVVRTENFTRAALELDITQQAVSGQIKKLEQLLGRSVFERTAAGIELTLAGEHLLTPAKSVISSVDSLYATVHGRVLPIRVAEIRSRRMMQQICTSHRTRFPHAVTSIQDYVGDEQIRALIDNKLDVATYHVTKPVPGIMHLPLRLDPVMALHVLEQPPLALKESRLGFTRASDRFQGWSTFCASLASEFGLSLEEVPHDITLLEAIGQGQIRGDYPPILALAGMSDYAAAEDFTFHELVDVQPYYLWSLAWRSDETRPEVHDFIESAQRLSQERRWLTPLIRSVASWFPIYQLDTWSPGASH